MVDEKDMAAATLDAAEGTPALRDEEGHIRPEYVETIAEAIGGRDAGLLRALVGELHEADMGDLIEALDGDLRPQLIELMGKDFDFAALTEVDDTVREEILEELEPWTVGQTIDYMRETDDLPERFFEIYVVDAAGKFLGAVPLDRLMRSKRPVVMSGL